MRSQHKWLLLALTLAIALVVLLAGAFAFVYASRWYTISSLDWARKRGVYATPQEGVITSAYRSYCGVEKVDIEQAATNSFVGSNPHVWFVLFTVYAKSHAPCDPLHPGTPLYHHTFERGGVFYLNVKEGWVMMPEGRFPGFIGFWMKVFDLAGPGDPTHVPRDWKPLF